MNSSMAIIVLGNKETYSKNSETFIRHTIHSSITIQESTVLYGGKISDQAKALSNFRDTEDSNKVIRYIQPTKVKPNIVFPPQQIGQKLNSQCLRRGVFLPLRYYSTVKDVNPARDLKRRLVGNSLL